MSETASLNDKTVHFETSNEGGESSGRALKPLGDSSGDEGAAPVAETSSINPKFPSINSTSPSINSKPPSINAAATSLNEETEQPAAVKGKQSDEMIEDLVDLFRNFLEVNPATSKSTRAQPNPARRKEKKRLFGLTKDSQPKTESNNPYDYEQKYPRDRPFEEMADNARVWLTYLDEAEAFDRERVEGWKDTVDVLLVFAGLFSGVITTFVSQASQSLQQDNTQVSASLLFEITRLLRAQSNGTPLNNITSSPLTPTSPFTPSTNALLVNGLWFTSLAIALSTALFAVLAKQWLHYYLVSITGTAQEKARARQLRFKGFESWNVGAIVELLPILLYTAVGMFLTGIIILLFPLDVRVAWTLVVITGITYILYFISVLLPIQYPECPYTTSLTIYIGILIFALRKIFRWISRTLEKGFGAVWRRMDFDTRDTIQRLLHNTLHFINGRLLYTLEFIRRHFQKLRLAIFADDFSISANDFPISADDFPKFTNWREENIKKAIKSAGSLDFEALNWLYGTSLNGSVHRIIARSVAVYPGIGDKFDYEIRCNLRRTLEISETNLVDLRYCLCLDLLTSLGYGHWRLLRSIPDVEEADTEYRSYSHIAKNVIDWNYDEIMKDVINNNLELPLVMWPYFFKSVSKQDGTIAAHMLISLTSRLSGLFEWRRDPTLEPKPNVGLITFHSDELLWWKLEYLYRHFFNNAAPDYSLDKTFETRYRLLITIYRNLTSDEPLIADKKQRQESLFDLFLSFKDWLDSKVKPRVSPEDCSAFLIDNFCTKAFWSESMTDESRYSAVECLDLIWNSMDTDVANLFPFMECDDLSPIYRWCSRHDLNRTLSWPTTHIFTLLFIPQNRTRLSTLLSNDFCAGLYFSNCFQNMRHCSYPEYIYPNLMDLLKSVDPKVPGPWFDILYNSFVLVKLWRFLLHHVFETKAFFLIVKSKLDQETLNDLYAAMIKEVPFYDEVSRFKRSVNEFGQMIGVSHPRLFERSVDEFGQMIGVSHPQLDSATEQSAPEHVPDTNERGSMRFIADWSNQAFKSLWLKIRSGNRDWDVELS